MNVSDAYQVMQFLELERALDKRSQGNVPISTTSLEEGKIF